VFAAALEPYLKVQTLLAHDSAEGVPDLLHQVAQRLGPVAANAALAPAVQKVADAAHASMNEDIETIRKSTFRDASNAMIAIGKELGLPTDTKPISVFRCPMAKADWLQPAGATQNPFYGSRMLDCGGAIEPLPKAEAVAATAATRPATQPGTKSLAIPRSAVIEAGRNRIVYVESAPGVYDMRAVQLGPLAGDYYPVVGGLAEGDKVVTVGAFLIDSENRLNPMPTAPAVGSAKPAATPAAAHQH